MSVRQCSLGEQCWSCCQDESEGRAKQLDMGGVMVPMGGVVRNGYGSECVWWVYDQGDP